MWILQNFCGGSFHTNGSNITAQSPASLYRDISRATTLWYTTNHCTLTYHLSASWHFRYHWTVTSHVIAPWYFTSLHRDIALVGTFHVSLLCDTPRATAPWHTTCHWTVTPHMPLHRDISRARKSGKWMMLDTTLILYSCRCRGHRICYFIGNRNFYCPNYEL